MVVDIKTSLKFYAFNIVFTEGMIQISRCLCSKKNQSTNYYKSNCSETYRTEHNDRNFVKCWAYFIAIIHGTIQA